EGYGKAVNVGFDRARGHYILLFESDDFLEPEMCEALYCHALTTSVDIVKSNGFFSFENNVSSPKPLYSASRVGKHGDARAVYKDTWFRHPCLWNALYRREYLIEKGVRMPETPGASFQDVSFLLALYCSAESMYLANGPYYHYRIHAA